MVISVLIIPYCVGLIKACSDSFLRHRLHPKSRTSLLYSRRKTICDKISMSEFIDSTHKRVGKKHLDGLLLPRDSKMCI